MALVTTCPHCGTSFRIVADQLKLRGGLVRCGSCLAVFSGLEKMSRVDDAGAGEARAEPTGTAAASAPSAGSTSASFESGDPASADPAEAGRVAADTAAANSATSGLASRDSAQSTTLSTGPGAAWDDDGPLPGETERRIRLPDLPPPEDLPSFGVLASPEGSPRFSESERAAFEQAKRQRAANVREHRPVWHPDPNDGGSATGSSATSLDLSRTGPGTDRTRTERTRTERSRADRSAAERNQIERNEIERTAVDNRHAAIDDARMGSNRHHAASNTNRLGSGAVDADDAIDAPDANGAGHVDDSEVAIGDEEMAIDYFSADERRRGFLGQHAFLKLATAGVLVVALIVQAVLVNRDWLAARLPALEPAIAALSAPFGLRIAPPRTIGALSIESFELQTDAASELLAVSAIIHNEARHPVRWPSMMLTLTDAQNRVLVRKAIDPADYLSTSTDIALRPNSERPIRLALEARDIRPAGYSVVLFHR